MSRRVALMGLLLVLSAAAAMVYLARPLARPDILLITVDTLRADHLGVYGYQRPTSPNLDAFAAQGLVFDRAFSQASLSAPSHGSLLASVYPPEHGSATNGAGLSPRAVTVAETLAAGGYATAMFVSDVLVSESFDFDQGFEISETHVVAGHGSDHPHEDEFPDRAAPTAVFDAAIAWLTAPREEPFFLWVHAAHPHESYEPPTPFDEMFMRRPASSYDLRCGFTYDAHASGEITLSDEELAYMIALYDGEIAYADRQIGRLLAALDGAGGRRETVVVITADHGEMLFDDAAPSVVGHGRHRWDQVLRVPLVIRGLRRIAAGARVPGIVRLIDVAPTLVEIAGQVPPAVWQGRSLLGPLRRGVPIGHGVSMSLTWHSDAILRTSLRTASHKLVVDRGDDAPRRWLYDLERDPGEVRDVAREIAYDDVLRELTGRHDEWLLELGERVAELEAQEPGEEARELLRRAGYLPRESKEPAKPDAPGS